MAAKLRDRSPAREPGGARAIYAGLRLSAFFLLLFLAIREGQRRSVCLHTPGRRRKISAMGALARAPRGNRSGYRAAAPSLFVFKSGDSWSNHNE